MLLRLLISVRLSICPSICHTCSVQNSVHTVTQSGSIVAQSGLLHKWLNLTKSKFEFLSHITLFNHLPRITLIFLIRKTLCLFTLIVLVADSRLYKRLRPSIHLASRPSVHPSVCNDRVEKCENAHLGCCNCDSVKFVCGGWRLRVKRPFSPVRPCLPVRDDIVTGFWKLTPLT